MPASGDTVFKDPVCKMTVDEKMVQFISEIRGRKVHLCSAICKDKFDTNPKKYGY
jgi:Cu+-exporting ATPase